MRQENKSIEVFIVLVLFFFPLLVFSHDVSFRTVSTQGSGCPEGTTSVIKTDDQKTVSILFDDMSVAIPNLDGHNENDQITTENRRRESRSDPYYSHKTCAIKIEAAIEDGMRVDSLEVKVDYRGMSFLDRGVQGMLTSSFVGFTAPQRQANQLQNQIFTRIWKEGGVDHEWLIETGRTISLNTQCSRRQDQLFTFALQNIIKAQVLPAFRGKDVHGQISLDSADLRGSLIVKIKTSPCSGVGTVRPGPPAMTCPPGYSYNPVYQRCLIGRRGQVAPAHQ